MVNNILVPLDGSELAERALPYATALVRRAGGRLILLRAVQDHSDRGTDAVPAEAIVTEWADAELSALAERLLGEGLHAEAHVYEGDAAHAILDATRRRQADMIVMSTHGRTGLGRWVYGSVADDVLRHSETPVLLVPPHSEQAWPTDRPLRVLVPLDGSALAEEALGTAGLLAETFGAELLLLRVVEPPVYPLYGDGYAYIPFDEGAEQADAERYLQEEAARLRASGAAVRVRVAVGQPSMVVAAVASEEGADVIAMATHGRGGLARLVMGSVATGALQRATVPLLLTRPAALEQPVLPPRSTPAAVASASDQETAPSSGSPVTVTLGADEARLVRQVLESFLADSRREEHVTGTLRDVLEKLETPEPQPSAAR